MRFKKYLKNDIIDDIIKHCKPFIKDNKGFTNGFLYSGRSSNEEYFQGVVRNNRNPLDTNPKIHKIFDNEFKKQFGWNVRSNSLFCTSDYIQAQKFGTPYIIFPKGSYKFVYHPKYKDFVDFIPAMEYWNMKSDIEQSMLPPLPSDSELKKISKDKNIPFNDFRNDLLIQREKSIRDKSSEIESKVLQKIKEKAEEYVSGCKNDNIINAIKSKNEVMLNTKEYIAVRYDYIDILKENL